MTVTPFIRNLIVTQRQDLHDIGWNLQGGVLDDDLVDRNTLIDCRQGQGETVVIKKPGSGFAQTQAIDFTPQPGRILRY